MAKRLVVSVLYTSVGLFIADYLIPGFEIKQGWLPLLILGFSLGLANLIAKPILKLIALPLRIITLGLFNFVINLFLIWLIIDVLLFEYAEINGIFSLFWTTLIVWLSEKFFNIVIKQKA